MMKKKWFAFILAVFIALPFIGCATEDPPPDSVTTTAETAGGTTADSPQTEPEIAPELPDIRFEGTELVFVHRPANAASYKEPWISTEGTNGDILNDSVFKRNLYIEEKYGTKIVSIEEENPAKLIETASMTNDDLYDVMMGDFIKTGEAALKGQLYNLNDLEHVDFTKPWWDSNCAKGLAVDGKLYAIVSDISLMAVNGLRGIYFNRDLIRKYEMDDPYDLVKNNKWTLDKMAEMTLAVSDDLNGDGKYDDQDRFGMLTEDGATNGNVHYFLIGCGIQLFETTDDGISISFMNEKAISVIEKCRSFLMDSQRCLNYDALAKMPGVSQASSNWNYGRMLFASDHFLFTQSSPRVFDELNANNMESEYGIVPNPKYDEAQESYYHKIDRFNSCLSIPATNAEEDLERISILLEDMAYMSSKTILPAYYDTVIALRRARVPEVAEMIDIMKNSIYYDISVLFSLDSSTCLGYAYNSGNIASSFKMYEKSINTNIKTLVDSLHALQ